MPRPQFPLPAPPACRIMRPSLPSRLSLTGKDPVHATPERTCAVVHLLLTGGRTTGGGPHAAGLPARPRRGAALRPRLPLSAGRLDRPAHRGRTLRARRPARPAAGPGDRRPRPLLRRHAEPQGARRRLEADAHPRQRPVPAPLRQGIPRRDEGHRRRRQRRRAPLRRPAHRPASTSSPSTPGRRSRRSTPPSTRRRPAWKACASRTNRRRPKPPPKPMHCSAFAATGPATARRQDRLRPHHHVQPLPVELLQRLARRQAAPRAIAS